MKPSILFYSSWFSFVEPWVPFSFVLFQPLPRQNLLPVLRQKFDKSSPNWFSELALRVILDRPILWVQFHSQFLFSPIFFFFFFFFRFFLFNHILFACVFGNEGISFLEILLLNPDRNCTIYILFLAGITQYLIDPFYLLCIKTYSIVS